MSMSVSGIPSWVNIRTKAFHTVKSLSFTGFDVNQINNPLVMI